MRYAETIQRPWAQLSYAELRGVRAALPPGQQKALTRAWMECRPHIWLPHHIPDRSPLPYSPGVPRTRLIERLSSMPPGTVPREPHWTLAEMGRGLGKTETTRGFVLARLLSGADDGVLFTAERADDAEASLVWMQRLRIPPYRVSERSTDPVVRQWLKTPLGQAYPGLRWEGGAKQLRLHRPWLRRDAYLWGRGAGAKIRGIIEDGIRPTIAVADDIISSATGWSQKTTTARLELLQDEVAGLGYTSPAIPCAIVVLANALHPDDLGTQISKRDGWVTVRGSVWSDPNGVMATGLPESAALDAILQELRQSSRMTEEERLALAGRLVAAAPEAVAGYRPTDPGHTVALLLLWQAAFGTRAFSRIFCCARHSSEMALWPWLSVKRVTDLDQSKVKRCAVWLDPRYSEDETKNDFAAAVGIALLEGDTAVVVSSGEARCHPDDAVPLLWSVHDETARICGQLPDSGYEKNPGLAVHMGEEFRRTAMKRLAENIPTEMLPDAQPSIANKYGDDRLGRMVGLIETGRLAVLAGALSEEGERQCLRLGTGYHDDIPDAMERAHNLLAVPDDPLLTWADGWSAGG